MSEERTTPRTMEHRVGDTLPPELLEEASKRLGRAALLYSVTFTLAFFGQHLVGRAVGSMAPGELLDRPIQLAVSLLSIVAGFAVYALSKSKRFTPSEFLDLGLVFWVLGCLGIGMSEMWNSTLTFDPRGYIGLSWICVWLLVYPMIAPNAPRKTLIAGLIGASMQPLVLLVAIRVGVSDWIGFETQHIVVYSLLSTYLCALMAYVISRGVYRFGRVLNEARSVGSYRLVERIGEGGMGEVWRAEHNLLAKPAAVKLIRPDLFDESFGSDPEVRFEREARATSRLRSVHTIELYDYGVSDDGLCFYVMELLDGLSLEDLAGQHGPQPPSRVIHLLRQACRSLEEAHHGGMVHRDIKPANLFACRFGTDVDFVKVLDFGLVKHRAGMPSGDVALTGQGVITGTPAYAAPEMMQDTDVDGRADLYSLGCVAYWLLTATPVFTSTSAVSLIVDHAKEPPEPPSSRLGAPVPSDLEAVILRCLEKDPGDRYGSAAELDHALAACGDADGWDRSHALAWWDVHGPRRPIEPVATPLPGSAV